MNSGNDFDMLLTGTDHDEMPDADAFVDAVTVRVVRLRRYRRFMLGTGGGVALVVCAVLLALPIPAVFEPTGGLFNMIALLALACACGLAWVATEDTRLPSA